MKIWTVDAFTNKPFAGNPAGVMIFNQFPNDAVLKRIAGEVNLSETAFIRKIGQNHFHLRWFTPTVEVKLCGHGTLSAAHILHQEKMISGNEILFDSLSGPLKVYVSPTNYTLDFPLQKTEEHGLELSFLENNFNNVLFAIKAVDDVIVEVSSEEEVRHYKPRSNELEKIPARGIILTAKGHGQYDFVSRFFCPRIGIAEDPVTGSAHCKLAHYWQKKLNKNNFIAYQASPRGGEIHISVIGDRVQLTGNALTILKGDWQIPLQQF